MPGGWELLVIVGVLLLLFGAKKLPEMARSIGQSARVFKGEMKGLREDEQAAEPAKPAEPAPPAAAPAPLPPVAPPAPTTSNVSTEPATGQTGSGQQTRAGQ